MSNNSDLPNIRVPIVNENGTSTNAFYKYFLSTIQGLQSQIASIKAILASLGSVDGTTTTLPDISAQIAGKADKSLRIITADSLVGGGDLSSARTLSLQNDLVTPPALSFYGALTNQVRGWQTVSPRFAQATIGTANVLDLALLADTGAGSLLAVTRDGYGRITGTKAATITGTAGRVTVANGDASAGLPTVDLATVADAGGGTLQKTAFDAYGRKTGTSAASTTDLAEGTNLYFTVARVLATILAGLSTATNAVITAADSVLVALGKLQAQITATNAVVNPSTSTFFTTIAGVPITTIAGDFISVSV